MRSIIVPFLFCLTLWAVALPNDPAVRSAVPAAPSSAPALAAEARVAAETGPRVVVDSPEVVQPGRLITIAVEDAPADTKFASFGLTPEIHGLRLYDKGNGRWEGSFAILPSMAGQQFRPQVKLYDAERRVLPLAERDLNITVAAAEERQPGVVADAGQGRTAIAFDQTVRLDTVTIAAREAGGIVEPELRNNYLLLPAGIEPDEIVTVSALNLQGERVVLHGPASDAVAATR